LASAVTLRPPACWARFYFVEEKWQICAFHCIWQRYGRMKRRLLMSEALYLKRMAAFVWSAVTWHRFDTRGLARVGPACRVPPVRAALDRRTPNGDTKRFLTV